MNLRSVLGGWAAPLWIHGQNQSAAMLRAAAAQAQGLDPALYGTPLPGSNVTSTTTTNQSGKGWILGPLLGLAIAAAGGAGTLGLVGLLRPSAAVPAPSVASPPERPAEAKPAPATAYDAVYEEQDPKTGEWKQTRREHLKSP